MHLMIRSGFPILLIKEKIAWVMDYMDKNNCAYSDAVQVLN